MVPARNLFVRSAWILVCSVVCAASVPLFAQTAADEAITEPAAVPMGTGTYQPPKVRGSLYAPGYPVDVTSRQEGWVVVSYMVDTKGRPYDVGVLAATGDEIFQREAIKAVARSSFYPAKFNGQPIDAVNTSKYTFTINGRPLGAGSDFIKAYKEILGFIEAGDRAGADDALRRLKASNLYEDAYWGLARYKYAVRWESDKEQLFYLMYVLGPSQKPDYLDRSEWLGALLERFRLQVKLRQYGEAIATSMTLKKLGVDRDTAAKIDQLVGQLQKLRTSNEPYDVAGELTDYGWSLRLFKPNFRISADHSLAGITLRCQKGSLVLKYDQTMDYHVQSDKYGECSVQVGGTPGTQLTLRQF